MDTRDSKFNGVAVLLFDEVQPLMHEWEQANRMFDFARAKRIEGQIQTIFARRGYDLVVHVLSNAPPGSLRSARSYREAAAAIEGVPDLAAWPAAPTET